MDKQQRGLLLVEQEEAEESVKLITEQLKKMAQKFISFGNNLNQSPENIVFTNAPYDLGVRPDELRGSRSLAWEDIPTKDEAAHLIQQLRNQQKRLKDVRQQLQTK